MAKIATYSPEEAAQLSGVSTGTQRDWRRHKRMPFQSSSSADAPGWKRFDLKEIAALTVMQVLNDLNVELPVAQTTAEAAADDVMVLISERIDDCQRRKLKSIRQALVRHWHAERFVVIGSDRLPQFADKLEDLLRRQHSPAVNQLDLGQVADLIVARAKKPFVVES
jgi:DNA-binding transcriptional MerR regulator